MEPNKNNLRSSCIMLKKAAIIIYILNILMLMPAKAKDKVTFTEVDYLTSVYFTSGEWKLLLMKGNEALENGIDYYYLRQRMGVAYYVLQNYRSAIVHFEKALTFNSNSEETKEYLYYSYLFGGRQADADLFAQNLPDELKQKINYKKSKPIESIYAEGGITITDTKNFQTNLLDKNKLSSEVNRETGSNYLHFGLKHKLSDRFSVYHGYSRISINKDNLFGFYNTEYTENSNFDMNDSTKRVWVRQLPPNQLNYYTHDKYVIDTNTKQIANNDLKSYLLTQNEYYINIDYNFKSKWKLNGAFHYINVKTSSYILKKMPEETTLKNDTIRDVFWYYFLTGQRTNFSDTAYYPIYSYKIKTNNKVEEELNKKSMNNYVVLLSLNREFRLFNVSVFGSYSNLNNQTQKQVGMSLTLFPFGNMNLYSTTTVNYLFLNKSSVIDENIGFKIFNNLWFEASATVGDMTMMNDKNAFIVYNGIEKLNSRWGGAFIVPLGKHLEISLRYQNISKQYSFTFSDASDASKIKTSTTNYFNQTILGGIKWKI